MVRENKKAIALPSDDFSEKKVNTNFSTDIISISQNSSKSKVKKENFSLNLINKKANLTNLLHIIDEYQIYLKAHGFKFSNNGLPIFTKDMFLDDWADLIIPYANRNNRIVKNKRRTLICFFDKDEHLYQRFIKVFDEIDEYKKYLGVVGIDVTFTNDMDEEWQKVTSLMNMLFMAILAVNGIKIVLNTRSAALNPQELFINIPKGVMAASGFLGCDKNKSKCDVRYISKILSIMPSKLIIYGKKDEIVENQLNMMGINYRRQIDFHVLSKKKEVA